MIIIEKDKHIKETEPFFSAIQAYDSWVLEQEFNNDQTTFISLGDLFHNALPTPKEYDEAEKFFAKSKFKKIILLAGNHDFSGTRNSHSILPLQNNPRIELILEPCQKVIEGKTFLFLPYYTQSSVLPPMKEYYSNLPEEYKINDYILYHFDDETIQYGKHKTGIDISYLKGTRVGGHIHKSQKNYELGMPVQSRFDEKGEKNNLLSIADKATYIEVPKFLDYYEVEYGKDLPKVEALYQIWDIKNAPSNKQARKFYKEKYSSIHIRDIEVKEQKEDEITHKGETKKSILEYFNYYIEKRTDLPDWTKDRLRELIQKR